jgi:DNA (cytosine-5)-methyltransferase 1
LGYSVEWRVINAAEYGFAQRRRRIFIYASRENTKYYNKISKFEFDDIILNKGFFAKEFPIDSVVQSQVYDFKYKDIVDISDNFKMKFENAGIMINGKIYTTKTIAKEQKAKVLFEIIEKDGVDNKFFLGTDMNKWNYLKGAKDIIRKEGTPFEYHFREGAIAFPDSLDKPARTMLTSEGSLNRSTHIIEDPKSKLYRIITPVEAERINGFPDNWTDTGMPQNFRYFCMGNALVVGLIEKMGNSLNEIFDNEE